MKTSDARTLVLDGAHSACAEICPGTPATDCATVNDALQLLARDPLVLIAGSLYLIGEVLERLGLSPAPPADERGLNEWSGRPA